MKFYSRATFFILICITLYFGLQKIYDPKVIHTANFDVYQIKTTQEHLQTIKRHLLTYRKQNGRYPTNDESLSAIKTELLPKPPSDFMTEYMRRRSYTDNHSMLTTDAGMISLWGLPFVYENRNGLDEALFEFSPVADEVANFDNFALLRGPSYNLELRIIQGIWNEFDLMAQTDLLDFISWNHGEFENNWLKNAIADTEFKKPDKLPVIDKAAHEDILKGTSEEAKIIRGIIRKETRGRHCFDRPIHLPFNSVIIAEKTGFEGERHVFTNGGLGFGQIHPFSRGARNVYKPDKNVFRIVEIMKGHVDKAGTKKVVTDLAVGKLRARLQLWLAIFAYNYGSPINKWPEDAKREAKYKAGVEYANSIFDLLGLEKPKKPKPPKPSK